MAEYQTDLLIVGGGTGGCAAAMSATALGMKVIMTEETDWLGGQLTSQAVPPDEHAAIETCGCTRSYREFRRRVREYYRQNYPLEKTAAADPAFNPGNGWVSRLCFEPRIGVAVLDQMLSFAVSSRRLQIMYHRKPVGAITDCDRITGVTVRNPDTGETDYISADYILDATETGELLPLAGVEYVSGAESVRDTGEPHAVSGAAEPDNVQSFTWCLAMGYDPQGKHVIDRPEDYGVWRECLPELNPPWPGRLLAWEYGNPWTHLPQSSGIGVGGQAKLPDDTVDLWTYRRLLAGAHFSAPVDEISLLNWPQNDYFFGNIIDKPDAEIKRHLRGAQQLSLSLLYWMQTEAPRPDGGTGYPGLYPRPDVSGNVLGLAKYPYIRESRRIKALFTVTECHVGKEALAGQRPPHFSDSVGVGSYSLDLHPSATGKNYLHLAAEPFQIPLRSLIPIRMRNLIAAAKNLGTTHITNGCYRLHPVEWNIGEAAGMLAAFCRNRRVCPHQVAGDQALTAELQHLLVHRGIELVWPYHQ